MKKKCLLFLLAAAYTCISVAQTNMTSTSVLAENVMLGNYDPAQFLATTILNNPDTIGRGINSRVSPDSLHAIIASLSSFENRNSGSDTVSSTRGIGAARRWAYSKFQQYSTQNDNRLIPSYLQFNTAASIMCEITLHSDVFAVLPGMDTSDKSIIVIEGHLDSRCAGLCDTACVARGSDDDASGSALVLELARVMSKYSFNRTIVFLLNTGEEQGLYGSLAFANYAHQKNISIASVMNNDIVGGVFCGHTSSAPSCPAYGDIDSTHIRIFSYATNNSLYKGLARFIKLEYKEMILPYAAVPMTIDIMSAEDRTGRGGDHQPFRQHNFTSVRFTSANEDGDANVTDSTYIDRQHTSGDSIGVDNNADGIIDDYYVDFDYLTRNAVINGNAAGMIAIGPNTPTFTLTSAGNYLIVQVTGQTQYLHYRVGVRSTTNDWDSVYTFAGTFIDSILILNPAIYMVSVASVDSNGIESLFTNEQIANTTAVGTIISKDKPMQLLQNTPNPVDDVTTISVLVNKNITYGNAYISIRDINGRAVQQLPLKLQKGINETPFRHGYHNSGIFTYSLVVDGIIMDTKRMTLVN